MLPLFPYWKKIHMHIKEHGFSHINEYLETDIFHFSIVDGIREIGTYMGREPGYIKPKFKWSNSI